MTDENNEIKLFLYENWARTKTGQHTVVSNDKTFKEHVSMLSFGNLFRRVCLMNKLYQNNLPKTCGVKKAVVLLFRHALLDTHRRLINCVVGQCLCNDTSFVFETEDNLMLNSSVV